MRIRILAAAAVLTLVPAAAFAQGSTIGGAATGAVVGGVVGGPVGAVVGAGIGAGVGSTVEPPREVITYVERDAVGEPVMVREEIVIGRPAPSTVQLRPVPNHSDYRYAYVNNGRIIVDSRGNVVKIIQ